MLSRERCSFMVGQDMDPTSKQLKRCLLNNFSNPKLAWHLFTRLTTTTTSHLHSTLPIITLILLRSHLYSHLFLLRDFLFSLPSPSPSLLSSFLSLSAQHAPSHISLSLFSSFRLPSPRLYNLLFASCVKDRRFDSLSCLLHDMILSGVAPDTYTCNTLLRVFCDFGRLKDARHLFDEMSQRGILPNHFTFGILIRGYCRAGLSDLGLQLLRDMDKVGLRPTRVVFNTLISSFCKEGKTEDAEMLVEMMRGYGFFPDIVTFNSRISALCGSGKVLEASRIFRDMQIDDQGLGLPRPNVVTYNSMLRGFFLEGMLDEANALVEDMLKNGADFFNRASFNIWLWGLVRNGKLFEARLVVEKVVALGQRMDLRSCNIIIDGFCKEGMLSDARKLMGVMEMEGIAPDIVTYTTLLHGCCRKGKVSEANSVLNEMMSKGHLPNTCTCNILLRSLCKEGRILEAEELLKKMNERGLVVDVVSCNTVIDGLCHSGQLDRAVEIVDEMWNRGSAALGKIGDSIIGLVDDSSEGNKCVPDLITYSTIITGLCRAGRLDEAKKKFVEMMGKNLQPDSAIYNIFIDSYCKDGKISSAFRVLKDMERKGCNKTLETYNSLIIGLGIKNQIFEIYGLLDEMRERGISLDVCTYNNVLTSLCKGGRIKDAPSVLDEMLQKGISPNISSFRILIGAFCKACDFGAAQQVFEIALNVYGHGEAIYGLMFNELLLGGQISEAKELLETALDRSLDVSKFHYKDLVEKLCQDEMLEEASGILQKLTNKGNRFDPAVFMPVIDGFRRRGNKIEADELAERMMQLASDYKVDNKIHRTARDSIRAKRNVVGESDWHSILHRDDGSRIAMKALKQVQKGWGQGSISTLQPQHNDLIDDWNGSG